MIAGGPVVCDAGPLMVLAKLNMLYLLNDLYSRVYIPFSVYHEVVVEGMRQGYKDARTVKIFLDHLGWTPKPGESSVKRAFWGRINPNIILCQEEQGNEHPVLIPLSLGE